MAYSKSELHRWRNDDDVTLDFFDRVAQAIESMDETVHELLLSGAVDQAAIMNARLQQLKEVFDIPTTMLHEAKGE